MDYKLVSALLLGVIIGMFSLIACGGNPLEQTAIAETGYEGECGSFNFRSRAVYYVLEEQNCVEGFTEVGKANATDGTNGNNTVCLEDI